MTQAPDIAEAYTLIAAERYEDAAAVCARVLALDPADPAALHARGLIELKRGRYAEAVASLELALAARPDNAILLNNCGEAYRLQGDNQTAFECFRRAIQCDSSLAIAHVNMGLAMRAMGKARESEHFFKNALFLDPAHGRAHLELAELYHDEGHFGEAAEQYRKVPAGGVEWPRAQAQLGSLLATQGRAREALAALERAVGGNTRDWRTRLVLAKTQFELCLEDDAVASYARVIADCPALSARQTSRVVCARRIDASDWCERGSGQYWRLARSHWLGLPGPVTIPGDAAAQWTRGRVVEPLAPEAFLCRVREAEVIPGDFVVLTADRFVILDGLVNWSQHYEQRSRFVVHGADDGRMLLDLPPCVRRIDEPVALLGGKGDYFAWLFEALARIWCLEQRADAAHLPVIVPAGMDDERRRMLEVLGITEERIRWLGEDSSLLCGDLYLPSLPILGDWISPLAIQFLRRRLAALIPSAGAPKRRLYLSRRGLATRRLANETELESMLVRHGFETVVLDGLSRMAQLELFGQAQALLAVDDEVLGNLVMTPQGAKVGVVVAAGLFRPRAYFISAQLGHAFTYLHGEPQFDSHEVHGECDIVLPTERLAEWLSGKKS